MNTYQKDIYNHILEDIVSGKLAVGSKLPTETALSKLHSTNRMNAHYALKKLEERGILWRNKRHGTYVGKVPNIVTLGELKCVNAKRVCIINNNLECNNSLHWNYRIVRCFEQGLDKYDVEIVHRDTSRVDSYDSLHKCIQEVASEGYNALLIVSDYLTDKILSEHPELLFKFHNNVFMYNRGTSLLNEWPYSTVSVNLFNEGVMAAEYLIGKGYENIVYVYKDKDRFWTKERYRGLEYGLMRGSEGKIKPVKLIFDEYEKDEFKFEEIIKLDNVAAVGANDKLGVGVMEFMAEKGYKAGSAYGLMGFDDDPRYRGYNLTTISPPLEAIGEELARQIVNCLDNKGSDKTMQMKIDSKLVCRETC